MRTSLFIFLFLFTRLVVSAQNTDAVTAYFKLIDSLQTGQPLDDSTWNRFLQVKVNASYIENNGVDSQYLAIFRKTLETIYLPQNDSLLHALLGKDNMINIYYPFKDEQKEMKAYLNWLQTHDVFDTIYRAAIAHLPKRMHRFTKKPLLFYETIELGGNSNHEAIYASFFGSYLGDKIKRGAYSGHEMHHFLRQSIPLRTIEQPDKGIMRALEAVLSEGTADLVDFSMWKVAPSTKAFYQKMTAASPTMLRQLNKDLEEMIPGKTGKDWNYFYALFQNTSGHFPGNYMSAVMVRNGYRKEMLNHCDDPFAFIRIYNKAAQKDTTKPPVFSQKAMRVIAALEKKYRK